MAVEKKKRKEKKRRNLAPGSAHARPSAQPPIDVSGNFLITFNAVHILFTTIAELFWGTCARGEDK